MAFYFFSRSVLSLVHFGLVAFESLFKGRFYIGSIYTWRRFAWSVWSREHFGLGRLVSGHFGLGCFDLGSFWFWALVFGGVIV